LKAIFQRYLLLLAFIPTYAYLIDSLPDGAKLLSRSQLYLLFSGKTEERNNGATFYSDTGKLLSIEDGTRLSGTWSTNADGQVCRHFYPSNEVLCDTYYELDGLIYKRGPSSSPQKPVSLQDGDIVNDLYAGSTYFSREETINYLADKTAVWGTRRGLYYSPDFTLIKIWDGIYGTGAWSVNEHGAVCWHIPGWGPTPCESYYYNGDKLASVFNGKHGRAAEHIMGNQLSTL